MELEISSDAFFSMELFSKHAREFLSHYRGCSNGPSPPLSFSGIAYTMKGWIIYRKDITQLSPEAYEIHRLLSEAEVDGIKLEVFRPEQFDLIVTREDEKIILINEKNTNYLIV